MRSSRHGHGAVIYKGNIVACGGLTSETPAKSNSCETYDITTGAWTAFPPMRVARTNFALVEADDLLFAIGGHDENSVEEYVARSQQWELFDGRLPYGWGHLSSVVVRQR